RISLPLPDGPGATSVTCGSAGVRRHRLVLGGLAVEAAAGPMRVAPPRRDEVAQAAGHVGRPGDRAHVEALDARHDPGAGDADVVDGCGRLLGRAAHPEGGGEAVAGHGPAPVVRHWRYIRSTNGPAAGGQVSRIRARTGVAAPQ